MKQYGFVRLNLRLHDGEVAPAAPAAAPVAPAQTSAPAAPADTAPKAPIIHPRRQAMMDKAQGGQPAAPSAATTPVPDGKPAQAMPVKDVTLDRKAEFEKLIMGEYKDMFAERTQQIINSRFKDVKTMEGQLKSYKSIAERVASKYGADVNDPESILKSVDEDDSYFEDEAMRRNMTVEQLKHVKKLEQRVAEADKAQAQIAQDRQIEARNTRWFNESEALKAEVPGFDLMAELQNPVTGRDFLNLINGQNPVSVKAAYRAIHIDDILGGAMAYTAQQVQQKTVADIKARGTRPIENGVSGHAPAQINPQSAKNMSREDHKNLNKRIARGELFKFGQ